MDDRVRIPIRHLIFGDKHHLEAVLTSEGVTPPISSKLTLHVAAHSRFGEVDRYEGFTTIEKQPVRWVLHYYGEKDMHLQGQLMLYLPENRAIAS